MALLPTEETRGVCADTGAPFYWRGWSDRERTLSGKHIMLRRSFASPYTFYGRPWVSIVGRVTPPFKVLPRYVDLHLYRTTDGTWVCQRAWRSEAHGELPVVYAIERTNDLFHMTNALLEFDPCSYADTLWPADQPGGKKRRGRAEKWMRDTYRERVALCMKRATEFLAEQLLKETSHAVDPGRGDRGGPSGGEGGEDQGEGGGTSLP